MLSKAAGIVVLVAGFFFAVELQVGTNIKFLARFARERRFAHEQVNRALKPASEFKVRQ